MFKIIGSIFVVYLIFSFLIDVSDNRSDIQKTTVYHSTCLGSNETENGLSALSDCKDKGGDIYYSKTEYRVDFKNQLVVQKGDVSTLTTRLVDCIVFDRENWICKRDTVSGWLSMEDGRFYASYFSGKDKNGKTVINTTSIYAIHYWIWNIKRLFGAR